MSSRRVKLERIYAAPLDDVWDLWTTKEGLESWWGPDGFTVTVRHIDLRPGGLLLYTMTATGAAQAAFMRAEGMPLTQELRITYKEVVLRRRLAYVHLADFIPGVAPYDVATEVELQAIADGVKLTLTFDAMHDDDWTVRATMGWTNELDSLGQVLANPTNPRRPR